MIVSGKISVKAILKERKREIECVYIGENKNDKETRYVERISEGLLIKRISRDEMDRIAGNKTHGGFCVSCGSRLSDAWDNLPETGVSLMCLEGVSDPYNLGEIMRTAASLGFTGVLTPTYNFYDSEAKLIRASAGATESLVWVQSDNLEESVRFLKNKEITVIAAYRGDDSLGLNEYCMPDNVCICLGGALRGLTRSIIEIADVHVRIDYDARVSLSTVGAASVFAYERFRQRGE